MCEIFTRDKELQPSLSKLNYEILIFIEKIIFGKNLS